MGRLWRFEDTIDTDVLAPGFYMKAPLAELASHCLEALRPEFASQVRQGDILLAGPNMGVGSSREQAAEVLKYLGIEALIAPGFAGIFYRNAINLGLPVFTIGDEAFHHPALSDGAQVSLNFVDARLTIDETGLSLSLDPLPEFLQVLINDGGLVPHLEKCFSAQQQE